MYDVLDSGESAFEFVENSTNSVIITLAKQVLTTVGNVPLMVSFMVGDKILSTFSIILDVSENPGIDVAESEDYFSLSAAIDAAKKVVGEMLDPNAFASKVYVDGLATDIREEIEEVSNNSKVFYVTFLETDGNFSADKSVPVIANAKQSGRSVKALVEYNGEIISVPLIGIIEEDTAYYAGYGIYGTYVVISQTDIKVSVFVDNLDCGIHPVTKSDDMTQPVGVDELGGLWTVPGSGTAGGSLNDNPLELINEITLDNNTHRVEFTRDANGEPFELEDFYLTIQAKSTDNANGHLWINNDFHMSTHVAAGSSATLNDYTVRHLFNAGQVVINSARSSASSFAGSHGISTQPMTNRLITKVVCGLAGSTSDYQAGGNFKLYGRRVKK